MVDTLIMICSFCSYHNPVCSPIMRPLPSPHSTDQGPSLSGTRGHSLNSNDLTFRERGHPACPVTLDVIRVCGSNIPFQPPAETPDIPVTLTSHSPQIKNSLLQPSDVVPGILVPLTSPETGHPESSLDLDLPLSSLSNHRDSGEKHSCT